MSQTLTDAAREACYAEGIEYKDVPADGRIYRLDVADDPHGKGDAAIKLFADGEGGWIQNHKGTGKTVLFWTRQDSQLTAAELDARRKRIAAEQQAAKQERERQWSEAAKKAQADWQSYGPAPSNLPQLAGKGILDAYGCKVTPDGRLATPVYGADDQIQAIQYRHADGQKRNYKAAKMEGGYWWIGTPDKDLPVLIATSFTTGASIYQAMGEGYRVYITYGDGNLEAVARMAQSRHGRRILLCGDDDLDKPGNPGRSKAEAVSKALGLPVIFPDFGPNRRDGATDFNDLAAIAGLDAVRQQVEAAYAPPPKDSLEKTYTFLSVHDLAALPPMRWRIKGVLPDQGVTAIYGPSGSGKSFIALDITGAVNTGRDWFGHRVNPAPVVYLCLEGQAGLRNRVAAYRTAHGGDALDGVRFIVESFNILTGDPAALIRAIKADGLEKPAVIIDTLNRAAPGADENSGVDMGRIIDAAHAVQQATGGLTALVHHCGKDTARGMRGHSSLHAALDAVIEVKRDGENRKWSLAKAKDGADGIEYGFALQVHHLGEDEDGDPVTSCSVVPAGTSGTETGTGTKARPPLGKHGLKAVEILEDLYDQHRANLCESGKPAEDARVTAKDWYAALHETGKMAKNRAYDARTEAKKKGYIRFHESYVFLVPESTETVPIGTGTDCRVLVPESTSPPIGAGTVLGTGTSQGRGAGTDGDDAGEALVYSEDF